MSNVCKVNDCNGQRRAGGRRWAAAWELQIFHHVLGGEEEEHENEKVTPGVPPHAWEEERLQAAGPWLG